MIIDCISDMHGEFPELEGGDLLLIAGDLTSNDSIPAWINFFLWLENQKYTKKIFIGGNHDKFLTQYLSYKDSEYFCNPEKDTEYICDSATEFEGLKIWGSPWTPWYQGLPLYCNAFTGGYTTLEKNFNLIPEDTDILLTHGPPMGILDKGKDGISLGSNALKNRLEFLNPKLHVFGHIHEGYGIIKEKTIFINASIMDMHYEATNKPTRIIL